MQIQEDVQIQDGRHDFDFLIGKWRGHQRRLRARLKGSTEWEEFESSSEMRPILGGLGNIDEVTMYRESGELRGATFRVFDASVRQWYIVWADNVNPFSPVPMIGSFKDGRGEFYAQEPFEGKAIFVRFIWTVNTHDSCRWEQAFSEDGGKTWETNWTMDFTRLE
ncbi:MAG: DUF1579 domain-containing protein [Anaerolineae bacterium]|nr:DUF1579 domain-containing protein [Anaerolineae bacterium]